MSRSRSKTRAGDSNGSRSLELSKDRVFESHGRGIALARRMSFDSVTYHGHGNIVVARIELEKRRQISALVQGRREANPARVPGDAPCTAKERRVRPRTSATPCEMQLNLLSTPEARTSIEKTYDVAISAEYEASTLLGGRHVGVANHRFAASLRHVHRRFLGPRIHGRPINTFRLDTIMRRISAAFADPASCLAELNQRFVEILPVGSMPTMLFGVVDAGKRPSRAGE